MGTLGGACFPNGACLDGLVCASEVCSPAVPGTDATGGNDGGTDAVSAVVDAADTVDVADAADTADTPDTVDVSDVMAAGSCLGRCGTRDAKLTCQCDAACVAKGDCCADKTTACPTCAAKCTGKCGGDDGCGQACPDTCDPTKEICDPATWACKAKPVPCSTADGTPCDDGNACTAPDLCQKSICSGAKKDCNDGNACTSDACDIGSGCTSTALSGGPCDDGDACKGDTCSGGKCVPPLLCSTCSLDIGPAGGTLKCDGATLVVPAGALAATTKLTLESMSTGLPSGFSTYSLLYHVAPESQAFAKPAQLSLPYTGDSNLASLFWSQSGTAGWKWTGGASQAAVLTADIGTGGYGFVADGVQYVQVADKSCAKLNLIEGRTQDSHVAMFFTADDCFGNPITDLKGSDFVFKEDGKALSVEATATVLQEKGLQVFVTLALDFSGSTDPLQPQVIAAAKAFVNQIQVTQKLPAHIAIEIFDGSQQSTVWQKHTLDTPTLLAKLDALQGYKAKASGTNLNGAIVDALSRLDAAEKFLKALNQGGAFTTGYLVLFTDGADTTGYVSDTDAVAAEAKTSDQVLGIGLASGDYDQAALEKVAPFGVFTAADPTTLGMAFQALGTRIAGQVSRTYLVGYCSVKKAGKHTLTVELNAATTNTPASYQFDATGFGDGCTAQSFVDACNGLECGGLGCGACDDRVGVCIAPTGSMGAAGCMSFCDGWSVQVGGIAPGFSLNVASGAWFFEGKPIEGNPPTPSPTDVWVVAGKPFPTTTTVFCGLQPFTNSLGYEQKCADKPDQTWCSGVCTDATTYNFAAPACGQCAAEFAGPKCDQCANPKLTLPYCTECINPLHSAPDCDQCSNPLFAFPDCDQCSNPLFAFPDCSPPAQVLIPAGTFWMGCNTAKEGSSCFSDEKPQHKVTLSAYYMDLTETTVAQYKACVDAGVCTVPSTQSPAEYATYPGFPNKPVNYVNWTQSQQYCQWRGAGFDLPTEAQWEMAARGSCEENGSTAGDAGCAAAMRTYPWGETAPSASSGDSPYGLQQMAGNVCEWTRDWYSATYYSSSPATDPYDSASTSARVFRGGYFYYTAVNLRAGLRGYNPPSNAYASIGLRCMRSYP